MNKIIKRAKLFCRENKKQYESMKKRWVVNSLSIIFAVIILGVLIVCVITKQYYYSSIRTNLENRTKSTAQFMNLFLNSGYDNFYYTSGKLVSEFSDREKLEFQIIDSTGRILFSSSGITAGYIPSTGDIAQCLQSSSTAIWNGMNESTGEHVMSASSPVCYSSGQLVGAVRFATSMEKVDQKVFMSCIEAIIGGLSIFLLVFLSNHYFIRSIVNPIVKLNELTRQIAAGSYGVQIENSLCDELGELCDSINYMSDAICKAERMKNDIISSVSHELRTPLTAIGGWSETLLAGSEDISPLCKNGLEIIHKEAVRLSQMVEQLLDFSKLEGGRFTLQTESFDLRGEFSDAAFIYNDILKKDEIAIKYDEAEDPILVTGDKNRLRQVFLNIIDNAAKYGGAGGVIELSLSSKDGYAIATIRDYGAGIEPEDLPNVKEKFFRGTNQNVRGTGIGLSVCDEIIKLHGGSLEIRSSVGKGTEVVISLPLQDIQTIDTH